MEKFELTVVAQGSQSIWVAVLVIAIICLTITAVAVSMAVIRTSPSVKRVGKRAK
ncbi:hypothetical protein SAMN05216367_0035 [Tardiphaga sp. OK245]|nr:hypothetical protein SAMN05216367_0035 [Tardiphaga sp. OK245]